VLARRLLVLLGLAAIAPAQRGDRAGEDQAPLPVDLVVPPAPVLDVAAAETSLRLADGFAIAPFAAEPLVGDPVAATFDSSHRLWVVEMRGYMNDLDATNEAAPSGRIVVLHDDDRDGRADRSTVFVDGLPLPRAVLPLHGGALVIAPPQLLWCPDADGDLRADARAPVLDGFSAGIDNPEHSGNGLLWGFDQRIHLANDARVLRRDANGFAVEAGAGGGQWGISHDDRGRCYFNYNEDWLRCDLLPGRYGPRAVATGGLPQLNWRVAADASVYPIRVTPGVNRGYQPGRLVDGVLAIRTAVCGPHVYRGEALPACNGDVFVCEPAGNLVRRIRLGEIDGWQRGANAYAAERAEFLASTDERFRPVNLLTGPDGALYVVDMYRGVIQHRNFVTSFLRRQIVERGLERPTGLGRIWRITAAAQATPTPLVDIANAESSALVAVITDSNGALRDLAMRELVQRRAIATAPLLRTQLAAATDAAVRIALLATLAGLHTLGNTEVRAALRDADPGVRAFALSHAAPFLRRGDGLVWAQVERLAADQALAVRWQLALTLGDALQTAADERWRRQCQAIWLRLLVDSDDHGIRAAVACAAQPTALVPLLEERIANSSATNEVIEDLAKRATTTRQPEVVTALLALAAKRPAAALPMLHGLRAAWPTKLKPASIVVTDASALASLHRHDDADVRRLAGELLAVTALAAAPAAAATVALTDDEAARVRAGERVFARACAACHQLDGRGMAGLAPPLRDSEWVTGEVDVLARIALHGVRGPLEVASTRWNLEMPGQRHLSDTDLAAVLGYLRRAFGHGASVPTVAEISALRQRFADRSEPWTAAELSSR
jgi:mono/diheme cytochrome c family protein/glucose/arabinose dehydrogenase